VTCSGPALAEERHGDTEPHWECELGDVHFAINPAANYPAPAPPAGRVSTVWRRACSCPAVYGAAPARSGGSRLGLLPGDGLQRELFHARSFPARPPAGKPAHPAQPASGRSRWGSSCSPRRSVPDTCRSPWAGRLSSAGCQAAQGLGYGPLTFISRRAGGSPA